LASSARLKTWEIMDRLLIFRSGFPGNLVAAILDGINISVFVIIKLPTLCV
jgi:hypothetical protein